MFKCKIKLEKEKHICTSDHNKNALARFSQQLTSEAHILQGLILTPTTEHIRQRRIGANEKRREMLESGELLDRVESKSGKAASNHLKIAAFVECEQDRTSEQETG